jgi:hypothetical protein
VIEEADDIAADPDIERLGQRPHPAGVLGGHDISRRQGSDQPR